MQKTTLKNIFISYRKQDTPGETGRLADALSQHFAEDQIFRDIERLEPGEDFVEGIGKRLQSCDVMLAIIGPNWLGFRDGKTPRIQDPDDWVRIELTAALQRNIRVVPVLVNGGQLPLAEELPSELQLLLRRQTYEISDKRWKYDTEQLIDFLVHKVGIMPKRTEQEQAVSKGSPVKRNTLWVYILGGLVVAAVLFFIVLNVKDDGKANREEQNSGGILNANNNKPDSENSNPLLNKKSTNKDYKELIPGSWTNINDNIKATLKFIDGGYLNATNQISFGGIDQQTGKTLQLALAFSYNGTWSIQGNRLMVTVGKFEITPLDKTTSEYKSQLPKAWEEIVETLRKAEGESVTMYIISIDENQMRLEEGKVIRIWAKEE